MPSLSLHVGWCVPAISYGSLVNLRPRRLNQGWRAACPIAQAVVPHLYQTPRSNFGRPFGKFSSSSASFKRRSLCISLHPVAVEKGADFREFAVAVVKIVVG